MILAAGFGTRLLPLTESVPKPLVKIDGKPMIENVVLKLIESGINRIIINTHYLAEQVEEYFSINKFDAEIILTYEKDILGTGGGIMNAGEYLKDSGNFLVYNADIVSEINIHEMYDFHLRNDCFVTLAVKRRNTSRPLLRDHNNNLIGREAGSKIYMSGNVQNDSINRVGFCGIHIISSNIFNYFTEKSEFDIIIFYTNSLLSHEKIMCYDAGDILWKDMGKVTDFE